ncbi:MAG: hypothetical protein KDC99_10860 [Cyclobacteriaceae bacterium]|nr:hypothetical protein [Cyclobacteriaceae bacterium]
MRQFLLLFPVLSVLCCSQPKSKKLDQLDWLRGSWNRTNVKAGKSAHERWEQMPDGTWQGWGVSFTGSDTSFVENIKIIEQDNKLYYVADVPENKEPVYFEFTALTPSGFVCENPSHDFPKKIEYNVKGNSLEAVVSGHAKSISFQFEKGQ